MSFPVVIGSDTVLESAFSGTGYTTAFLDLIEKLGNYSKRLPYGTSTSSVAIGTGTKVFQVQTGRLFTVGDSVRAFNSSSNLMEGVVVSYNEATGDLTVNVSLTLGAGTFSAWNLVPTGTVSVPMPMSRGGSPTTSLENLPKALGLRNKTSVMVCESNFFHDVTDQYHPFYFEYGNSGTFVSGGNVEGAISGNYAGVALLSVPAQEDSAFVSYGDKGFIYLGDGGDLEFQARTLPPTGDGVVVRLGLMVDMENNLSDQFSGFGFGFELTYNGSSYTVSAVVNDGEDVHRTYIATMEAATIQNLCIRFCASDKTVRLSDGMEQVRNPFDYLNPFNFLSVSLKKFFTRLESGAALKRAGLLRPFFFAENSEATSPTRSFPLDSFVCTRFIRRG